MHLFLHPFLFYYYNKLALPSRQPLDIYCFITVLEVNHETNCHFIFVYTMEWKIL